MIFVMSPIIYEVKSMYWKSNAQPSIIITGDTASLSLDDYFMNINVRAIFLLSLCSMPYFRKTRGTLFMCQVSWDCARFPTSSLTT